MIWKIFEINQNLVGSICPWCGWAKDRIFSVNCSVEQAHCYWKLQARELGTNGIAQVRLDMVLTTQ